MFATTLWLLSLVLESLLLVQAFRGKLIRHYRLFYSYLLVVTLRDISLLPIYYLWPRSYGYAYWFSAYLTVVMGCGVVWEAYKIALSRFPGAARMARNVIAFIFVFSISRLLVKAWDSANWIPGRTTLETERDLRTVQMGLLLGLVVLFAYYGIPLGRNLKGIIYGFIAFVGVTIAHLTFGTYLAESLRFLWPYVISIAYFLVLVMWCKTLWVYESASETATDSRLEMDYQSLVSATKKQFRAARSQLFKAVRP